MDKRLVQKFDYSLMRLLDTYRNLADVNAFVDSSLGSDSTGDGTYSNPRKTIAKVKASGATYRGAGKVIMVNGYFDELTTINVGVIIIGCGGGLGGRAIFGGNITTSGITTATVENCIILRNSNTFLIGLAAGTSLYGYNNIFQGVYMNTLSGYNIQYYTYYCIFNACVFGYSGGNVNQHQIQGNNNTLYGCSHSYGTAYVYLYGNNNHSNNTLGTAVGFNNIKNVNGQYLDPTNYNFNFLDTSPLYETGTFNGLFGNYNHVGAGTLGLNKNGASVEMTAGGGAVLTNMTISGTEIYRPNVAIDGTIWSSYIDFGDIRNKVVISSFNTYVQTSGTLNRLIQETTGVDRNGLDYLLKYGNSTAEVDSCPELKVEQGKIIAVSGSGASRVGNTDPTFNETNFTFPSFQYCKVGFRAKTV